MVPEEGLATPKPAPLSHPVRVETIKPRGTQIVVTAAELAAIARILDIASLEALEARYELARNGERVKLEGTISASLHQSCIVTLEDFPVRLTVPVKLDFEPLAAKASGRGEDDEIDIEIALNEDDPPEPIIDGFIDLGAVTLEFLALALDPYPRKPGASFSEAAVAPQRESPFAALAALRDRK